jgi:hypothetical protein
MEHGPVQVRQLVEQPDREVRGDDRHVDEREAPRLQSIRERKHLGSIPGGGLSRIGEIADALRKTSDALDALRSYRTPTIDHGWREVADTALAFVRRFT